MSRPITKGVTVEAAPGVYAGITATSGDAVESVGTAAVVVLRGLSLNGLETAQSNGKGIDFQGGTLQIENCVINGFAFGVTYISGAGRLTVRDTIIRNCSVGGMFIQNANAVNPPVVATIDHCRFDNNRSGLGVAFNTRVTVRDSIFAGDDSTFFPIGLGAFGSTSSTTELKLKTAW